MNIIVNARNKEALKGNGGLLVGYLPAGYPDRRAFLELLPLCDAAGLDIFEIGFPSSSPDADGEVIRRAHQVIDHSVAFDDGYWESVRACTDSPIWIMGYAADLVENGRCLSLARLGYCDAFVIPDLDSAQTVVLGERLAEYCVDVVALVRPDMSREELEYCFANNALIYQQLYSGQTGESKAPENYLELLEQCRKHAHTSIFAGFGIKTPQRVKKLWAEGFDGAVVGTEMVSRLSESQSELLAFITESKK